MTNFFYGFDKNKAPILGAKCHQQEDGQPAGCFITDIDGNILFRNIENPLKASDSPKWVLASARVTNVRLWNTSTAVITLKLPISSLQQPITPLPTIEKYGMPVGEWDEIVIWMGWLDYLRPIADEDKTNGHFLKVFTGVIDTVSYAVTKAGVTVMLQCRDRLSYLMDSIGSYNSADFASQQSVGDVDTGAQVVNRSDVIVGVVRLALGDLGNISNNSKTGSCTPTGIINVKKGDHCQDPAASSFSAQTTLDPYKEFLSGGVLTATTDPTVHKTSPLTGTGGGLVIHAITGRMPYLLNEYTDALTNASQVANFTMTDRIPIEVIRFLSLQEPWVTELFSDPRTGDIWYAPRGMDLTGFDDKTRFNRTYYVREFPSDQTGPHSSQMVMSFRSESTKVGYRSNIIAASGGQANTSQGDVVHIRVKPPRLKGRDVPASYYYIQDPSTLSDSAELVVIALKFSRYVSHSVRAGAMTISLDPSLLPGEVIQVAGSVLNNSPPSKEVMDKERTDFKTYYETIQNYTKELTAIVQNSSGNNKQSGQAVSITIPASESSSPATIKSNANLTAKEDMCLTHFGDGNDIQLSSLPETIWRVEGVVHHFNDGDLGYTTEVQLANIF